MAPPAQPVTPPELNLHYRDVQSSSQLAGKNHVVITVRAEVVWTSTEPARRTRQIVLEANRGTADAGPADRRRFAFVWPDQNVARFVEALRLIGWHVENRNFVSGRENEVYVELNDCFRIGWLDRETEFSAFADFSREGASLRVELDDLTSLHELQRLLAAAVVPPKAGRKRNVK